MADDRDDVVDSTTQPGRSPGERMPRWVKVSLIVAGVLGALFVIAKLTGAGGDHGPGRHGRSATPSVDRTPAASTIDARP
jgi:hypothetical protein